MAFMEPFIYGPMDGVEVTLRDGSSFVFPNFAWEDVRETYDPRDVTEVGIRGFFGRYSAPGYLDCTEWDFDASESKLLARLNEMYGDEDDDATECADCAGLGWTRSDEDCPTCGGSGTLSYRE